MIISIWPIDINKSLPITLFSKDHLSEVFFEYLPLNYKCSTGTIRQALKAHLKRTAPAEFKLISRDLNERDSEMAELIGNHSASRGRASEIKFVSDSNQNRRGRSGRHERSFQPASSFAQLIWTGYTHAPEMLELHGWIKNATVEQSINDGKYFLTAESLSKAITTTDLPVAIDSIWLARSITLFASLLKRDQRIELILKAIDLGCSPIAELYDIDTDTLEMEGATDDNTINIQTAITSKHPQYPSYALPEHHQLQLNIPSAIAKENADTLSAAEINLIGIRNKAAQALPTEIDIAISLKENEWKSAVKFIESARSSYEKYSKLAESSISRYYSSKKEIEKIIGIEIENDEINTTLSAHIIGRSIIEIDAICTSLKKHPLNPGVLNSWMQEHKNDTSLHSITTLINHSAKYTADQRSEETYLKEVYNFCNTSTIDDITSFLESINAAEILILLRDLTNPPWVVAGAILFRILMETEPSTHGSDTYGDLLLHTNQRRQLLRFFDPTTSIFDNDSQLRRVIALERLRDAIEFGPVAQVSDPASGLSDIELVGRAVHELVVLIMNNLDILVDGNDIIQSLMATQKGADAASQLEDFIKMQPTMTGNFRKLREKARDLYLAPILNSQGPIYRDTFKLSRDILSGETLNSVIASFEASYPNNNLESRHRDQLSRYLKQANVLIKNYLNEKEEKQEPRRRDFIEKLVVIHKKFRAGSEFGTQEWLESEVSKILLRSEPAPDFETLSGHSSKTSILGWKESDRTWVLSMLDLPELYERMVPKPHEIIASVLKWKSTGSAPTPVDVIEYLVEKQNFSEAMAVALDTDDSEMSDYVLNCAAPTIQAIEERAKLLKSKIQSADFNVSNEQIEFDTALSKLDIEAAEELLEFWQMIIDEEIERTQNDALDPAATRRRNNLTDYLLFMGFDKTIERMDLADLEKNWENVIKSHAASRQHLVAVSNGLFRNLGSDTELESVLEDFAEAIQNPRYWLLPELSSKFTDSFEDTISKVAGWLISYASFRDEEQVAAKQVTKWYLNFILERSASLRELDESDAINSGLDRVLEAAIIVLDAIKPSDTLFNLVEIGEVDSSSKIIEVVDEEKLDNENGTFINISTKNDKSDDDYSVNEVNHRIPQQHNKLPSEISDAIANQDWELAVKSCNNISDISDYHESEKLMNLSRSLAPFLDDSALPDPDVADGFPAAAAWLAGSENSASYLSEFARVKLAFKILSGAIAAESGQAMQRTPDIGGSWAELLGKDSPFRRMLTGEMPSRTGRVLEALLSGTLGSFVAERIWDAATNLSEAQNFRTPLLNFLEAYGAEDIIIKLAKRYEPAIAPRLTQLFELRLVAQNRPDLLPVAQSVGQQVAAQTKTAPFRSFVKGLKSAAQIVKPQLRVIVDGSMQLRSSLNDQNYQLPLVVQPEGLVPTKLMARLFSEDDVSFPDGTRLKELSRDPIYFATDFSVNVQLGTSWSPLQLHHRDTLRIRIEARTVTDELIHEDAVCVVRPADKSPRGGRRIDVETLLELYPGVANTPVVNESFIGRIDELERLHQVLISSRNPSPVLLTGMRRVGKTSLLYAFHNRCNSAKINNVISVYLSLAERRVELVSPDYSVSDVFFRAIAHGLVRQNLPSEDRNYQVCYQIRKYFKDDWRTAKREIQACQDDESLSGSLLVLSEKIREWTGSNGRIVFLIDEAEALVAPYQAGGQKKVELEQFLQSLREVSQTTGKVGLLLSGSNHINVFAREYKNAFFGSSQSIELEGFKDAKTASLVVAPRQVATFIKFEPSAIQYAWELCAGMPQFLWQIGATVAYQLRSGTANRSDIRAAITRLIGPSRSDLPFRPYEILEPIDSMLSLEAPKERDLLWMLLYRVAQASSLAAQDAAVPFVIDQTLLLADDRNGWNRRLASLTDLKVLRMDSSSAVRFQIPIFAEGFRAQKNWQEYILRQQQVGI